jgi:hypothetical protein
VNAYYDQNGVILDQGDFCDGTGVVNVYATNGKIIKKKWYKNGRLTKERRVKEKLKNTLLTVFCAASPRQVDIRALFFQPISKNVQSDCVLPNALIHELIHNQLLPAAQIIIVH